MPFSTHKKATPAANYRAALRIALTYLSPVELSEYDRRVRRLLAPQRPSSKAKRSG